MKNYLILLLALCSLHISCSNNQHSRQSSRVSFTVEESDDSYRIIASYDPQKANSVAAVLDEYLRHGHDPSFANAQIDAEMTISDKTTFHLKQKPGELDIELEKGKNDPATLRRFKAMAEKIKKTL